MNPISLTDWSHTHPHYECLRAWRNDTATRQFSFKKTPFTAREFQSVFEEKYYALKDFPPKWILFKNQKVGLLYVKPWFKKEALELSLFLDPFFQGKGIGAQAIIYFCHLLKSRGIEEVISLVLPENTRAQKVFQKAGFEHAGFFEAGVHFFSEQTLKFRRSLVPKPSFYVIAEAGSNFKGNGPKEDLIRAKKMIEIAYQSGAQAIKFQLFKAKEVYAYGAGAPSYLKENITDIFERYALDPSIIEILASYAHFVGIEWMCSAFSEPLFDLIDPWVKRHKIASYELHHLRLLQKAAQSKKPLILSTGACSIKDIKWALSVFKNEGGKDITLMHCNAQYPAQVEGLHLNCIPSLKKTFKVEVGFSDHSEHPTLAPTLAYALGARVIEKHFTLSKNEKGPDHFFALEPFELKSMIDALRESEKMLGLAKKRIFPQERDLAKFTRRGVHALKAIQKGDLLIENQNIAILRPGNQKPGMHSKYLSSILDKRANKDIAQGEGIQREHIQWN